MLDNQWVNASDAKPPDMQPVFTKDVVLSNPVDALLPCPFCGSSNLTGPHLNEYVGDEYCPTWWIECDDCPCAMEGISSRDEVVAVWNQRVKEYNESVAPNTGDDNEQ